MSVFKNCWQWTEKNVFGTVNGQYGLWCAGCVTGLAILYFLATWITLDTAARVIKLVSLTGIIIHVMVWGRVFVRDISVGFRAGAIVLTLCTLVVMAILLVLLAFLARDGREEAALLQSDAPNPEDAARILEIIHKIDPRQTLIDIGLNALSVAPICIAAVINQCLLWFSGASPSELLLTRKYLYVANLPIIYASATVFVAAALFSFYFPAYELKGFLNGAMAFLVFSAFYLEAVVGLKKV